MPILDYTGMHIGDLVVLEEVETPEGKRGRSYLCLREPLHQDGQPAGQSLLSGAGSSLRMQEQGLP